MKRRRFWVRLSPATTTSEAGAAPGTGTLIEIAGLARTDSAGWGREFNRRSERILGLEEEELDETIETESTDWDEHIDDDLDR